MIRIDNISKSFDKILAINNVSATIHDNSIFGLIGSNGAGKSTLLRILAGIYRPDRGSVTIDDQKVFENKEIKKNIFYISDDPFYFHNCTMAEMKRYYKTLYSQFDDGTYKELLDLFKLDGQRRINTFSKGMTKQAFMIFALSAKPKYLFCDETFDGLDPVMRQAVKGLIAQRVADHQMVPIIASHNLRELEDICDHVGLLHQGGIVFDMDLEELNLGIHKVQCAFSEEIEKTAFSNMELLDFSKRGKLITLVAKGKKEEISEKINKLSPIFYEMLPLSLEEIFISEMEGLGYDAKAINI